MAALTVFGHALPTETLVVGAFIMLLVMRFYKLMSSNGNRNENSTLPSNRQTLDLIKSRRTVMPKEYLPDEKLSTDEIEAIVEAANWAPTHQKNEPWRYAVLDCPKRIHDYLDFLEQWYEDHIEKIDDEDLKKFRKKVQGVRSEWPEKVSHLLLIGMKRQAKEDKRLPEWEEICAVAMSVQNMHLMATSLDRVGGFWSSHTWCKHARDSVEIKEKYFKNLLNDPEDRVFGAFVLGKYAQGKTFRSTRTDMSLKIARE